MHLPEDELQYRFVRASGPGGQNVNKVSTAVQLRWDLATTTFLTPDEVVRLRRLAGHRVNQDGVLIIDARNERSQRQNREAARRRLGAMIGQARVKPKPRRPTKATRGSVERRLASKKQHGEAKRRRQAGKRGDW